MVWQKAHQLTLELYVVTKSFPEDERFGLTAQIRRCASSVGANIAEGSARKSAKDFGRFLRIAFGSASELENHLLLAADLEYISKGRHAECEAAVMQVKRMLTGLSRRLMADG
ncbi:MAG TPA: four helix bundle protein [Gemmatimonadales bacterium]|nr:four helix bundle protein [Gemmatimonadales bacterium]